MSLGLDRKYEIDVDFDDFKEKQNPSIVFVRGDTNTSEITMNLKRKKETINLTDCLVLVNLKEKSYEEELFECEIVDATKGIVMFKVPNQYVDETGTNAFSLNIKQGEKVLCSPIVKYKVVNSLAGGYFLEDISKTYVGGLIDAMGDKVANVSKYIEFDITKTKPTFHAILNVAKGTVLQCYAINEYNDEIYTSQLIGSIPPGVAETYTISRLDRFGKLLDFMDVRYGGHGTSFGLEIENGKVYIWSNFHRTDENGVVVGDELVRFPYQAGKELFFDDPSVEIFNKFNNVYTIPTTDNKNGLIGLRYTDNLGKQVVELRRIRDIKNNANILLGKVVIPDNLTYLQGITIDGYNLYWRVGDTNAVQYKDEIVQFDFRTGEEVCRIEGDFGKGSNNEYEDNFREPEGIYLYTDLLTGKKTLFASVVTGGTARRLNKSYAFHQLGNGEKFNGDILTTVQKFELTKSNGYAKSKMEPIEWTM